MSQSDVSPSQSQQPQKGVAVVTGAARGIGRGIALRLADDGFDIAVNDLPGTPELDEVIKAIEGKGRRALATPGDVSDESVVAQIIHSVVTTLGSLNVVRSITTRARDHSVHSPLSLPSVLRRICFPSRVMLC
jgi:NAD(P)-dependent dehydrogenase (short-subunit alcohol dehydrogenase family)